MDEEKLGYGQGRTAMDYWGIGITANNFHDGHTIDAGILAG